MNSKSINNFALVTVVTGLSLTATNVSSQEVARLVLEEVIVTAQKRSESVQEIAASVTAVGAERLNDFQVVNALDIEAFAPNVSVGSAFGTGQLFIRGIGLASTFAGIDPSVALHVDGAVVSPGQAQLGVFYDVERVEVLRGPQGSLYGRNSTGGSINVVTQKPTEEFSGYIHQTFGNYNLMTTEAAISGPIVADKLLARLAIKSNRRDGFGENETFGNDIDDADQLSGRFKLEYRPSDDLNILLSASRQKEADNAYTLHFIEPDGTNNPASLPPLGVPGLTADDPRNIRSNYEPADNERNTRAYSAVINWDIDDSFSLTSITAHRTFDSANVQDLDGSLAPGFIVINARDIESTSQELQLHYQGDRLNGLVGLYYYQEDLLADSPLGFDPVGVNGPADAIIRVRGVMDVEAWAAFANFTYRINDQWSVILGGRYSDEEREKTDAFSLPSGTIPFADKGDWSDFTLDIGLQYQPVDDINFYAKFSQGFKSGAANLGQISSFVDPEKVDAYEVGVKGQFFDNVLGVNASLFYYDFTDMQLAKTTPAPGGAFGSRLENAGESEVKGAEVEITWLATEALKFDAQFGYLDTEIKDFVSVNELDPCAGGTPGCDLSDTNTFIAQQFAGNQLVQAPEYNGNLRGEYELDLNDSGIVRIGVGAYHRSKIYFSAFNTDNMSEGDITVYDANIKYLHPNEQFSVNIWGKNLTDEEYYASKFAVSTSFSIMGSLAPPSTYGVTINYAF